MQETPYTVTEVSRLTGYSRQQVYELIKRGLIPAFIPRPGLPWMVKRGVFGRILKQIRERGKYRTFPRQTGKRKAQGHEIPRKKDDKKGLLRVRKDHL